MRKSEHVAGLRAALGKRLADHRKQHGLSQLNLSKALGYDRTSITKIEAGQQHAPEAFWRAADRMLDARGELLAEFNALATASQIGIAIELEALSRELSEHSRRVLMGESADWAAITNKLGTATVACRHHVIN